jgi:hypothetical protein
MPDEHGQGGLEYGSCGSASRSLWRLPKRRFDCSGAAVLDQEPLPRAAVRGSRGARRGGAGLLRCLDPERSLKTRGNAAFAIEGEEPRLGFQVECEELGPQPFVALLST